MPCPRRSPGHGAPQCHGSRVQGASGTHGGRRFSGGDERPELYAPPLAGPQPVASQRYSGLLSDVRALLRRARKDHDQLGSVPTVQLVEETANVRIHGRDRQGQGISRFGVGPTCGHLAEAVQFAFGEMGLSELVTNLVTTQPDLAGQNTTASDSLYGADLRGSDCSGPPRTNPWCMACRRPKSTSPGHGSSGQIGGKRVTGRAPTWSRR
jgi:hypothetical protein